MKKLICCCGFAAALVVVASMIHATQSAYAGKPASPPVKFQVKLIAPPADRVGGGSGLRDMNNLGQLVGVYSVADTSQSQTAFLYDPHLSPDTAMRLDWLMNPADIPAGWYVRGATGVNDNGVIIGYLARPNMSFYDAGIAFALYGAGGPDARLVLLPDRADAASTPWTWVYPEGINDDGDIVCTFQENGNYYAYVFNPEVDTLPIILPMALMGDQAIAINNSNAGRPAQIAGNLATGEIFRYTLGDAAPEVFSTMSYYSKSEYLGMGLNDAGSICGRRYNKGTKQAINFDGVSLQAVNAANGAADINQSGDMVIWGNPQLYHQEKGMLNLSDLVVGSAADVAAFKNSGWRFSVDLTERGALSLDAGAANFPAVAGYLSPQAKDIFILLPVSP